MRRCNAIIAGALAIGLLAGLVVRPAASWTGAAGWGPREQGRQARDKRGPRQPSGRGPGEGRARNPVMLALDTDGDGELSAAEIANAAAALRALDRDGDGRLSREELRPEQRPEGSPKAAAKAVPPRRQSRQANRSLATVENRRGPPTKRGRRPLRPGARTTARNPAR